MIISPPLLPKAVPKKATSDAPIIYDDRTVEDLVSGKEHTSAIVYCHVPVNLGHDYFFCPGHAPSYSATPRGDFLVTLLFDQ
jgi:hypothetical protein